MRSLLICIFFYPLLLICMQLDFSSLIEKWFSSVLPQTADLSSSSSSSVPPSLSSVGPVSSRYNPSRGRGRPLSSNGSTIVITNTTEFEHVYRCRNHVDVVILWVLCLPFCLLTCPCYWVGVSNQQKITSNGIGLLLFRQLIGWYGQLKCKIIIIIVFVSPKSLVHHVVSRCNGEGEKKKSSYYNSIVQCTMVHGMAWNWLFMDICSPYLLTVLAIFRSLLWKYKTH